MIECLISSKGSSLEGILCFSPTIYNDDRGFFYESWNLKNFNKIVGKNITFVQDNHSRSAKGVIRGLHYQVAPHAQGKLIRCVMGEIFDVVVDLRRDSPSYGEWGGIFLSSSNFKQLWIPPGFAHGFLTLTEFAEINYKVTDFWFKECERSIKWDDKSVNIVWPSTN